MALDFPDSPNDGDYYEGFVYSSSKNIWRITKDPASVFARFVAVAGGGAGGYRVNRGAGGAGAGGVLEGAIDISSLPITTSIVIGAGAAGVSSDTTSRKGSNTLVSPFIAEGGGGGGSYTSVGDGGSGGGEEDGTPRVGTGVPGQGNSGGTNAVNQSYYNAGGGGGAGAPGQNATATKGGDGGVGRSINITGSSIIVAGGGGGGTGEAGGYGSYAPGAGGSGIGGQGGSRDNFGGGQYPTSGAANTGSGGGGSNRATSGSGGSGIVYVSVPTSLTVTPGVGLTYTTTVNGLNTVYTITGGVDDLVISL